MTPTEELIGEVLAARSRLGESIWTFNSKVLPAAKRLERAGLIIVMHGIVENTFRAYLTVAGREEFVDPDYEPPVFAVLARGKEYALRINCEKNRCEQRYGKTHSDDRQVMVIDQTTFWRGRWDAGFVNGHMCDRLAREVRYGTWQEVGESGEEL